MRASTAMKQIESEPTTTEYTLIFPRERRGTLREWLLLKLVSVGYETLDVENYVFGRFPQTVRIRPYIEETEEMRAILKMYLDGNRVEIQGESMEAVK